MSLGISRRAPRISVNKLGEYMTASPLRRRRIIADQRRPRSFIVPRYVEAQQAIVKALTRPEYDDGWLASEIERLESAPSATHWEGQRKLLCAQALRAFSNHRGNLNLSDVEAASGSSEPPRLELSGVEISVRPEVLLVGHDRKSPRLARGALKLYFSKSIPLSEEAGLYIASALRQFVTQHLTGPGEIAEPRHCRVIDVFGGQIFSAPRSDRRRTQDLQAACQEIARAWLAEPSE